MLSVLPDARQNPVTNYSVVGECPTAIIFKEDRIRLFLAILQPEGVPMTIPAFPDLVIQRISPDFYTSNLAMLNAAFAESHFLPATHAYDPRGCN